MAAVHGVIKEANNGLEWISNMSNEFATDMKEGNEESSQDVDIVERWNHLDHKQPLTRCIIIEQGNGVGEKWKALF